MEQNGAEGYDGGVGVQAVYDGATNQPGGAETKAMQPSGARSIK